MSVFFVLDLVLDFMLDRVHAMAHDLTLPGLSGADDVSKRRYFARGVDSAAGPAAQRTAADTDRCHRLVMRADARCGTLPAAVRYRPRCRSAWSTARRDRAAPGSRAGRRRAPTGGWRRNGEAQAETRAPAGRAGRAAAPWRAG